MTEWHYVAQRARTNEFLDFDLPLSTPGPAWTLSGAGSLSATISPDLGRLRADDGRLVLEEWGTFIYAVSGGEIRWGGILISSSFSDEEWTIEAAGFSSYPHGLTYDNSRAWTQVSPVVPFQELWANAQWRTNARLGVLVVSDDISALVGLRGVAKNDAGNNTAVTLADVTAEKWAELLLEGWQGRADDGQEALYPPARIFRADITAARWDELITAGWRPEVVEGVPDDTNLPEGATEVKKSDISAQAVTYLQGRGWHEQTRKANGQDVTWLIGPPFRKDPRAYLDPPLVEIDAAPYELSWWESTDIGGKIDELTQATPFDWIERHFWVPLDDLIDANTLDPDLATWLLLNGWTSDPTDGLEAIYRPPGRPVRDEVAHVIRIYYPRTGSRREDLAFIQGDNVVKVVAPTLDGDEYANAVIALGAGEGVAAVRSTIAVDDGRLYRAALIADKSVTDESTLRARAQDELTRRQNILEIPSITVRDHVNARIGSWSLGDDILVCADIPWLGYVELWCRVTGWALESDDTATLTLARSDSFRYGG